MGTKAIQVLDTATWRTMPGNQGSLNIEGAEIDDTIFGQSYRSSFPGIRQWNIAAQAYYKGVAGYKATLKMKGTPTALTDHPISPVTGKTCRITDVSKSVWDRSTALTFKDGGVAIPAANIVSINYLFGEVTFTAGTTFTAGGTALTVTGSYLPMAQVCKFNNMTLTMQTDTIDKTDSCEANINGGYRVYDPGLRTVRIELSGFYDASQGWQDKIGTGQEYVLELSADGLATGSKARGFFQLLSGGLSGNVGALEEQTLNFGHSVPVDVDPVFAWQHGVTSTLPLAMKKVLDSFIAQTLIQARYLPDGLAGWSGSGVVTDASMTVGLEQLPQFNFTCQGSGALAPITLP